MSFPTGDVNNFIVGSEEGTVYTACRHGSRAGILDSFEGHAAPVTGLSTHNGQGLIDFSHLFLTSSFDWTVKLWSLKENRPLYSFEDNGEYVYDVSYFFFGCFTRSLGSFIKDAINFKRFLTPSSLLQLTLLQNELY